MLSPLVYIFSAAGGLIILLGVFFAAARLSNSRARLSSSRKITPYQTRRARQNAIVQPIPNEGSSGTGEERNETHMEAGLVHLEHTPGTDGITAQSYNNHPTINPTTPNEALGAQEGANTSFNPNDRIVGELKVLFHFPFHCFSISAFEFMV